MPKIIFIPGNRNSSVNDQNSWFPWLKNELVKLGLTVVAKDFPDPDLARTKYWLPFLKNELKADKDTILIGHSSGAVAAMRYTEQNKIIGSILISPCHTDLGDRKEKLSGYFENPWNWNAIKSNQKSIVQFYSTDDPFIPPPEAHYIHEKLETEYHEFNEQGHFHPKHEFPEIVEVLKLKIHI